MNTPEKEKKGGGREFPLRCVVYLILVLALIAGVTLSRYTTTLYGFDFARAAKFDYKIEVSRNAADTIVTYDDYLDFDTSGTALNNLSGNGTQSVSFDVSLFATSKLAEADECKFDDVARVIDVTLTNTSEITVRAAINTITRINSNNNGIVWCLFNENELVGSYIYDDILNEKLDYAGLAALPGTYDFASLKLELGAANAETISDWNNDNVLKPGESKTLTLVFWAEYDPAVDAGWESQAEVLTQDIEIDYTVTQVD